MSDASHSGSRAVLTVVAARVKYARCKNMGLSRPVIMSSMLMVARANMILV